MSTEVGKEGTIPPSSAELTEVDYFLRRLENRTYLSVTFPARQGRDKDEPSRFVHKIFQDQPERGLTGDEEEEIIVLPDDPGRNRKQVRIHLVKERGLVRQITIQEQNPNPTKERLKEVLVLNRDRSARLIELVRSLDSFPINGDTTVRVDDDILTKILDDHNELQRLYERDPEALQALVDSNTTAAEIKELQHRRDVVETMQLWLDDPEEAETAIAEAGGAEKAWQRLLEENPWVLGVGLGGRLYTSWDADKLEQTVRGADLSVAGKRTDAFLVSNGVLRSVAIAEIKRPDTPLLTGNSYRSGVYGVSTEFSGAVAQVQETVRAAVSSLGEWLDEKDEEGGRTGRGAYLFEPRSFLVVGTTTSLCTSTGNPNDDKFRSFESYRANLIAPEVLTFDELVARARWSVELSEQERDE